MGAQAPRRASDEPATSSARADAGPDREHDEQEEERDQRRHVFFFPQPLLGALAFVVRWI
jgi:hypothetical protein